MAKIDDKDRKIPEVPHLENVTGDEKIPVSADGQPRYVDIKQINNIEAKEIKEGEGFEEMTYGVMIVPFKGNVLQAETNRYYRFDEVVNTLAIELPSIGETSVLKAIVLSFTTGDSPQVIITADKEVSYFEGYSIQPNTTYELNLMFNGLKWIVAYGVVE